MLAYNQVGGADPRDAAFTEFNYDSTVDNPAGPFIAGDGTVDLETFSLPKFNKVGLAAALGVAIENIRLEEVIISMGAKTASGFNVIDNESPLTGLVTNLTIGAEVTVRSISVPQQVILSALPKKNLCANGALAIGMDEVPELGGAEMPLFGGKVLNANFTGTDSLRVDITDMIREASEVTLTSDTSRPDGDDVLAQFIGNGTLDWKATGRKLASDQSNITRQTRNESPTFDVETRIVYIYSVAPEPATMAALGLGFLPLLARWRRRRLERS